MSSDDMKSLHDVYEALNEDESCQKTSYILQFLWRDLSSDYDVIGPYFTLSSTMDATQTNTFVINTMTAFHKYGFKVRCLVCDGASSNLAVMKAFDGAQPDSENFSASFTSPLDGEPIFMVVCPSHQVSVCYACVSDITSCISMIIHVAIVYYINCCTLHCIFLY